MIFLYIVTCRIIFYGRRTGAIIFTALLLLAYSWGYHFSISSLYYLLASVIVNIMIMISLRNRERFAKLRDAVFLLPLASLISSAAHFIS